MHNTIVSRLIFSKYFCITLDKCLRLWYNILVMWYDIKLNTERYRSGHNGADSKCKRPRHSRMCESSRFRRLSRKCSIFLEFWMRAFFHRPCICLAKFKHNFIRRDIEAVITGLTRNQFVGNHTRVRIPLSPPNQTAVLTNCGLSFYR